MSQIGWAAIFAGIVGGWLRSEIAICFEAVTKWLLQRAFIRPFKPSIETISSPTLRFLSAAILPFLLFLALYAALVSLLRRDLGRMHAFCFVLATFGFVATSGLLVVQIINHYFPSELGLACSKWGDLVAMGAFVMVAPPNLYLMWREGAFADEESEQAG